MNPTPEALALAVKLSGHCGYCEEQLREGKSPCDGCLGDAATIDRELRLPQRKAALAAAQAVMDDASEYGVPPERSNRPYVVRFGVMEQLRAALAAIKTK